MSNDNYDDRWDRWMDANGVIRIEWVTLNDGRTLMKYFRADGSEVDPNDSYGYDDLTPFSSTRGSA